MRSYASDKKTEEQRSAAGNTQQQLSSTVHSPVQFAGHTQQRNMQHAANNNTRVRQLMAYQDMADTNQSKKQSVPVAAPVQLRASKLVELSAQKHYNDGWGAVYSIQDDDALKTAVPNSVKGDGSISLGAYELNVPRFRGRSGNMVKTMKNCNILYKDVTDGFGKLARKATSIYHCGPTGRPFTEDVV